MLSNEEVAAIEDMADWAPDHPMAKFCNDPRRWYSEAVRLHGAIMGKGPGVWSPVLPPQRILDIGCGFGYFVRRCHDVGHYPVGLDLPGPPMIGRANEILGNRFISGTIKPFVVLPGTPEAFDLITMFGVMFRHGSAFASRDYWGWPEYTFLARDICSRLRPGGRLVIRPNDTGGDGTSFAHLRDANEWSAHIGAFATVSRTGRREVTITPKGPNDD